MTSISMDTPVQFSAHKGSLPSLDCLVISDRNYTNIHVTMPYHVAVAIAEAWAATHTPEPMTYAEALTYKRLADWRLEDARKREGIE